MPIYCLGTLSYLWFRVTNAAVKIANSKSKSGLTETAIAGDADEICR